MKKRLLSTLIILVMVVGMLPAIILNATATGTTGTTGDCTWSFDNTTGTLTVSGNGAMADYTNGSQPWYAYKDSVKTVIIEKGVTAVSANAFREFPALVTVKIAGSVTAIGSNAFYSCTNLSTVEYYGSSNPVADSTVFFGSYCVAKVPSSYSGTVFCEKMVSATLDAANEPVTSTQPEITDIIISDYNGNGAVAVDNPNKRYTVTIPADATQVDIIVTVLGNNFDKITQQEYDNLTYRVKILDSTSTAIKAEHYNTATGTLTWGEGILLTQGTGVYNLRYSTDGGQTYTETGWTVEIKQEAIPMPEITDIIISDRDGNGAVQVDTENKKYTITIPEGESETKITVTVKGNNLDKIVTDYEDMYWVSFDDSSAVLVSSDLQPTGDMQWGTSAYSTDVGTHAVKYSTDGGVTWTETGWTVEVKQETTATTPEYATKAELDEAVANLQTLINSNTATIGQIQQALADINAVLNSLDTTYVTHDELDQSLQGINHAISTIEQQLNTNIDAIADNTGSINALSTVVNGLAVTVNDLPTTAVTDALRGDLDSLSTSLSDLANRVSTNEANIATLQNQVTELNKLIEAGGTVEQIQQALTDINTTLNQLDAENRLSAAEDALKTLTDTTIPALTQLINDNQASIDAGATEISFLQTAVSHMKEDLKEMVEEDERLAGLIDSLDKNLADLATALDTLEGRVTDAETAISDLNTAIADLEKAMLQGDADLSDEIAALRDALEQAKVDFADADEALKKELLQEIEKAQATLQTAIEQVASDLETAEKELLEAIAAGNTVLDRKIKILNTSLVTAKAVLEAADSANKAELTAKIEEADKALQAAIEALQTAVDDLSAELDKAKSDLAKADADNKADLEAKDSQQQTFIIVVCVISCVALCGTAGLLVWMLVDKRKKR